MATKLVGYEHKAGIIEGTAYNNHLFHVQEEFPTEEQKSRESGLM